jgi:hypothetical protein
MTPRTVPIVCARAPRHIVYVPAVRESQRLELQGTTIYERVLWHCSFCGARVKVVA